MNDNKYDLIITQADLRISLRTLSDLMKQNNHLMEIDMDQHNYDSYLDRSIDNEKLLKAIHVVKKHIIKVG